jgi:lipid-A-disaccharide synthase
MDRSKPLDLFICCGELSGDQIGAEIVKNLQHLQIAGVIGPELRALNVIEIDPMESLQITGFFPIFTSILSLLKLRNKLISFILKENPKGVLLIDFSGFNTLLAKKLKKLGYKGKIIKIVCPQIWAWRKYRKKGIEKYHDALFTLFPFEKDLFKDSPLHIVYIGHPAAKKIFNHPPSDALELLKGKKIISLFPGSRKKDIQINLPPQLRSARSIPEAEICVALSFEAHIPIVQSLAKQAGVKITIVLPKDRFELMHLTNVAIAKFGTISLELALSKTPTVTMIKLDPITAFIISFIFRLSLPSYALPNILLNQTIFKEIILNISGEAVLHSALQELALSEEKQTLQRSLCEEVIKIFKGLDPGEKAAREILTLI